MQDSPTTPLHVTDGQLKTIMEICAPLQPLARVAFLEALANRLRGEVLGDGTVGRACRELQREFRDVELRLPQERT